MWGFYRPMELSCRIETRPRLAPERAGTNDVMRTKSNAGDIVKIYLYGANIIKVSIL
jgi:hypothetical protein